WSLSLAGCGRRRLGPLPRRRPPAAGTEPVPIVEHRSGSRGGQKPPRASRPAPRRGSLMPFADERLRGPSDLPVVPGRRRRLALLPQGVDGHDPVALRLFASPGVGVALRPDGVVGEARHRLAGAVDLGPLHAVNPIALDALFWVGGPLQLTA